MSPHRSHDSASRRSSSLPGGSLLAATVGTLLVLAGLARLPAQEGGEGAAPPPPPAEAPAPPPVAPQPPGEGPAPGEGPIIEVPAGPDGEVPRILRPGGSRVRSIAPGDDEPPASDEEIPKIVLPRSPKYEGKRIDIAAADIEALEFIRFLADYTGIPVILDSTNPQVLKNPITIAARIKDVTAEVVIAILKANRFDVTREVLPSGETVLNVASSAPGAVPTAGQEIKPAQPLIRVTSDRPVLVEPSIPAELYEKVKPDEMATIIFGLRYVAPSEATKSLNALLGGPKGARPTSVTIAEVEKSMLLIVTAKFGVLPFIQELLKLIDVPTREPDRILHIVNVENADADELVSLIQQFLQGRGGMGTRVSRLPTPVPGGGPAAQITAGATGRQNEYGTNLIADWRTQKIIVETYNDRDLEDILMLVRELDTRFDIRRLRTRIYQVRYLKAEEVAADLQSVIGGSSYGLSGRAGLGTRGSTSTRTTRQRGVARVGRAGATTGAATPGAVAPGGTAGAAAGMQAALIVPHLQTNSLIIQAEPEEYAEIMNILEQIDVKRRQVFLEAALVEVSSGSNLNYTIELLAGEPNDTGTRALFESSFGLSGLDLANWNRALPDTLAADEVPPGGFMAIMSRGKFPVLVQFFKSNTDSQVLATPFIVADDNQPNVIDILETIYVSNTTTGASQITTAQNEGEDAGITLEITPTISSQSAVFLEMTLEVSQFSGQGTAQVLPPKTTNTITSAVTIPDGEIFVIGGLTRENKSKSVSKIPILGDIPLLGKLFRSESTSKNASNLYIFLRAHVLMHPDFADGLELTRQADMGVRRFAKEIQYMQFDKPEVSMPPKPPADPDRPTRIQRGSAPFEGADVRRRSTSPEGFEAPQGPYEKADESPQVPGRGESEAPVAEPDEARGGLGGESPVARATAPAPAGRSTRPRDPVERGVEGGLLRPSEIPELEPPADRETSPTAADTDPNDTLARFGLEVDPQGESWIIPVRPVTPTPSVTPRTTPTPPRTRRAR